MRELSYGEAIREATYQMMEEDKSVIVLGEGVNDPTGMFGSTLDLYKTFGKERVIDVPNSENGFTGLALGMALNGFRPIIVHQRNDFLLLAMDQMVSQAAKWAYMFKGQAHIPLIVRAVIGRGWGQGAQHSQSLQSLFMHFPGLKVLMPANAYDAKGLLISALSNENSPIVIIEHRWLYQTKSEVPERAYSVSIGKGKVVRSGTDMTIVAVSQAVEDSLKAADLLQDKGIDVEIIDLRTIRPIDLDIIRKSLRKTGNLMVVDTGWRVCGLSAEVGALIAEDPPCFKALKSPIRRVTLADVPTPTTYVLENLFYPSPETIVSAALEVLKGEIAGIEATFEEQTFHNKKFSGSF